MKQTAIIFNPAARGTKARALGEKIQRLAGSSFLRPTSAPGEARSLAADAVAEGCTTIVAAGGDGTINEVVNGIGQSNVKLGLLPIGTMNVFAAELGLPMNNLRRCWDIIEAGHVRRVDLARANHHYFVQLGGIGFDAQIVQTTSWNFKRSFGPLSYVITGAQIAAQKPPRLTVEADGKSHQGSFVLVGNGRYYGGPFIIFKNARIDDGKLDVLIFKNLGYLDIVRYLHGIIFGRHLDLHDVTYFQTRKMLVRSEQDVPVEVDGEVIGNVPVTFHLAPRKLKVIAPAP
jgi:diacylglycerol kinase (ATP)